MATLPLGHTPMNRTLLLPLMTLGASNTLLWPNNKVRHNYPIKNMILAFSPHTTYRNKV